MKDPILFDFMGLHLQEPMAFIFNLVIAGYCFFAYNKLRAEHSDAANNNWRRFYLTFGVSTIFGAFGHLFMQYTGIVGKFPCWTLGGLANIFAARAMMQYRGYSSLSKGMDALIWVKSGALLLIAIILKDFLFIAVDAILTYIIFTGIYGYILYRKGLQEMRFMVTGVIILLPSAFFFILKWNPHKWFNAHDVSHVLMLICIAYFYKGASKWSAHINSGLRYV